MLQHRNVKHLLKLSWIKTGSECWHLLQWAASCFCCCDGSHWCWVGFREEGAAAGLCVWITCVCLGCDEFLQEVLGVFSDLPGNVLGIMDVFLLDVPKTWSCEMISVSCSHLGEKCKFPSCNTLRACFTGDGDGRNRKYAWEGGEELHYLLSNLSKVTWTRILF